MSILTGEATQFFGERKEKAKLSLAYKVSLYRTRRVVPKNPFTTPQTISAYLIKLVNIK